MSFYGVLDEDFFLRYKKKSNENQDQKKTIK